jgi:hypothetical protein
MSRFPELRHAQFERFLATFCRPGTLKFRNNKWLGLTRDGDPFVVHVKHGTTRKYPPPLVEAVAKDLDVSFQEFLKWYQE